MANRAVRCGDCHVMYILYAVLALPRCTSSTPSTYCTPAPQYVIVQVQHLIPPYNVAQQQQQQQLWRKGVAVVLYARLAAPGAHVELWQIQGW